MNLETKIKPLLKKMRKSKWFIKGNCAIRTGSTSQCPLTFFAGLPGVNDYAEGGEMLGLTDVQCQQFINAADLNSNTRLRKLLLRAARLKSNQTK